MAKQTPFEEMGWKKDDLFRVLDGQSFEEGSIVQLLQDDYSSFPRFRLIHGRVIPETSDGAAYCSLAHLEPLDPDEQVPAPPVLPQEDITTPPSPPHSVLTEAQSIIYGDREQTYGKPGKNLNHIAEQWSIYLNQKYGIQWNTLVAEDVCWMMADLKKCRQMNSAKRDNLVDAIGYIALIERLEE